MFCTIICMRRLTDSLMLFMATQTCLPTALRLAGADGCTGSHPRSIVTFRHRRVSPAPKFFSSNSSTSGTAPSSAHRSSACWATFLLSRVPVSLAFELSPSQEFLPPWSVWTVGDACSCLWSVDSEVGYLSGVGYTTLTFCLCCFRNRAASVSTAHAALLHILHLFQGTVNHPWKLKLHCNYTSSLKPLHLWPVFKLITVFTLVVTHIYTIFNETQFWLGYTFKL